MNDLTNIVTSSALDVLMYGWLDAKFSKSGSQKTKRAYEDTLLLFRNNLQFHGLDLDTQSDEGLGQIALIAQAFSRYSAREGKQVKTATINQRLAIISSFYVYAIKHCAALNLRIKVNPMGMVERSSVQAYARVAPLEREQTTAALADIDRATLRGKRDYALLSILFSTGRRLSEVASLTLSNIHWQSGRATLTFEHCKGGKVMRDTLPLPASHALAEWISAFYGGSASTLDTRPVWTVLKTAAYKQGADITIISKGDRLGEQSIADICKKHLGTSKVHITRHTYAHEMEKAGASVSTIQAKLGHESIATTGRYLAALSSAENEFADAVGANIGIR